MNKFSGLIRANRGGETTLRRHLSAALDMDSATPNKIEKGEKTTKREYEMPPFKIFSYDFNQLYAFWLADQGFHLIDSKSYAMQALGIAERGLQLQTEKY